MGFKVVIPARFGSTRLPGKPLREIAGRPLIAHVHDRALESGAEMVIVATDDHQIREACEQFDARVCMTSPNHPSGTDRLAEVAGQLGFTDEEIVVNLQGDEPLMPPVAIRQVADILMQETSADLATLCTPITSSEEMRDPNVVKVVAARTGSALYFSRAPIPHHRDGAAGEFAGAYRHVGIYGYRVGALRRLAGEAPCELEGIEKLEQLRALWLGMRIQLGVASEIPGPGVDTETDLEKVSRLLAETVFLPE